MKGPTRMAPIAMWDLFDCYVLSFFNTNHCFCSPVLTSMVGRGTRESRADRRHGDRGRRQQRGMRRGAGGLEKEVGGQAGEEHGGSLGGRADHQRRMAVKWASG